MIASEGFYHTEDRFYLGISMSFKETVMFEKCPLCGQANVTTERTSVIGFFKPKVGTCTSCSAEFLNKGENRFQLVHCEPHRLIGRHDCADRIFRGCYLDATLTRKEWKEISEGGELADFSKFLDAAKKFNRGTLPTYHSKDVPFTLERDEVVHYVSSPVYINEQKSARRKTSDKGHFYLTNKRIVFIDPSQTLNIPLEELERVDDSPPGFLIREKGSSEPLHFYPTAYDPISAAVRGAIRNLKKNP
jgi:hypothetical protein